MKITKQTRQLMISAAKNKVQIDITAERIAASKRCTSNNCMTAQALRAALPEAKNISVDQSTIRWTDPEKRVRVVCLTPRPLQIAIGMYESGIDPEPLRIKLMPSFVTQAGRGGAKGNRELIGSKDRRAAVPVVIGGKTPPLQSKLINPTKKGPPGDAKGSIGNRREFGIRAKMSGQFVADTSIPSTCGKGA